MGWKGVEHDTFVTTGHFPSIFEALSASIQVWSPCWQKIFNSSSFSAPWAYGVSFSCKAKSQCQGTEFHFMTAFKSLSIQFTHLFAQYMSPGFSYISRYIQCSYYRSNKSIYFNLVLIQWQNFKLHIFSPVSLLIHCLLFMGHFWRYFINNR